jgi:hypothetical protein
MRMTTLALMGLSLQASGAVAQTAAPAGAAVAEMAEARAVEGPAPGPQFR